VDGFFTRHAQELQGLLEDLWTRLVEADVVARDDVVELERMVGDGGFQIDTVDVGDDTQWDSEAVEELASVAAQMWALPVVKLSCDELASVCAGAKRLEHGLQGRLRYLALASETRAEGGPALSREGAGPLAGNFSCGDWLGQPRAHVGADALDDTSSSWTSVP